MFPDLNLPGDRDAEAALDGFLYQFKLTLLRWFTLGENDVLFPETGEDILLWRPGLTGENAPKAVMEQIKKRSRSITLSSPAARASLAHCFAHREANPAVERRFRFITNAKIGREKQNARGIPGITLWQQVHSSETHSADYVLGDHPKPASRDHLKTGH